MENMELVLWFRAKHLFPLSSMSTGREIWNHAMSERRVYYRVQNVSHLSLIQWIHLSSAATSRMAVTLKSVTSPQVEEYGFDWLTGRVLFVLHSDRYSTVGLFCLFHSQRQNYIYKIRYELIFATSQWGHCAINRKGVALWRFDMTGWPAYMFHGVVGDWGVMVLQKNYFENITPHPYTPMDNLAWTI